MHGECLQIAGGVGVTVRNSTFVNCMVFDLSITEYNGSGPPTDYLIENNVFGPRVGRRLLQPALQRQRDRLRNFVVRNNSSTQAFSFSGLPRFTNVRVVGNVARRTPPGLHQRHHVPRNVWNGAKCGATDINAASGSWTPVR